MSKINKRFKTNHVETTSIDVKCQAEMSQLPLSIHSGLLHWNVKCYFPILSQHKSSIKHGKYMFHIRNMRPVPTKWETSCKISFESYKQIHDVQPLSFQMIYNLPGLLPYLGSKTYNFLEKFLCFLLIFEMLKEPYLLYLVPWQLVVHFVRTDSSLLFHMPIVCK